MKEELKQLNEIAFMPILTHRSVAKAAKFQDLVLDLGLAVSLGKPRNEIALAVHKVQQEHSILASQVYMYTIPPISAQHVLNAFCAFLKAIPPDSEPAPKGKAKKEPTPAAELRARCIKKPKKD